MAQISTPIKIGNFWTNLVDSTTGENVNYEEVTEWFDGTPMDDSKADGEVYRKLPSSVGGGYVRRVYDNFGQLFLEKDTMAEMRDLSSTEILLIQIGRYKGVKLNGYYEAGDTPNPIEYLLSETLENDDGGSVIEVGDIKLEHEFGSNVNVKYYGIFPDTGEVFTEKAQRILDKYSIEFDKGMYVGKLDIPVNRNIFTNGRVEIKASEGVVPVIITGSALELNDLHIDGQVDSDVYAGDGLVIRGGVTGIVKAHNCSFKNVYGSNLSLGAGNLIGCRAGNYMIDFQNCIFDSHASDFGVGSSYRFASRAIFASTILGGIIDSCKFYNDGKINGIYPSGSTRTDIESITVATDYWDEPQGQDLYFTPCDLTISNNQVLDAQTRAVKIQASNVKVVNNTFTQPWSEGVSGKLACISLFGSNCIISNNNLESGGYVCVNVCGYGNIISNNNMLVNKDNLHTVAPSSACITLYTASNENREIPNTNTKILGNKMFSGRAININGGRDITIQSNKIDGQIFISGTDIIDNVTVESNIINIPTVYSNIQGVEVRIADTALGTGNLYFRNNTFRRCTRTIDLNAPSGLLTGSFIMVDNIDQGSTSGFINRLTSTDSRSRVKIFNSENNLVTNITTPLGRFDLNSLSSSQGRVVKADGGVLNLENSPGNGYWIVFDRMINDNDHIQFAFRTNNNGGSDLLPLDGDMYYRIYSILGTSTGWSPWVRMFTREQFFEQREITVNPDGVTNFGGSLAPYWYFSHNASLTINPTIQRGRIYIKAQNTSSSDIVVTISNGIFPDGTDNCTIPANSKRIISVTCIDYNLDRMCFMES